MERKKPVSKKTKSNFSLPESCNLAYACDHLYRVYCKWCSSAVSRCHHWVQSPSVYKRSTLTMLEPLTVNKLRLKTTGTNSRIRYCLLV